MYLKKKIPVGKDKKYIDGSLLSILAGIYNPVSSMVDGFDNDLLLLSAT